MRCCAQEPPQVVNRDADRRGEHVALLAVLFGGDLFQVWGRSAPERRPLAAERGHDDRVDHEQDVRLAGVVGADLGALLRVEDALEERAEDARLDACQAGAAAAVARMGISAASFRARGGASSNRPPLK
jgi:hypothetical protein